MNAEHSDYATSERTRLDVERQQVPPTVRVTLRVQPVDVWQHPAGEPYWLQGLARLYPDHELFGRSLDVRWGADDGAWYRLTTEEPPA